MKVVVKYAKRGDDGQDLVREVVLPVKRMVYSSAGAIWTWHEFVSMAVFHKHEGERIVAIIEGGYQ